MTEKINLVKFGPTQLQLTDVQLVNLVEYNPDTKTMQVPKTIGYYRQPESNEYPLNLSKGYERYIHRDWTLHSKCPHDRVLHYLMQHENPKDLMGENDFCINRQTIKRIMEHIFVLEKRHFNNKDDQIDIVAVRFKKCIFLHVCTDHKDNHVHNARNTFAYKARQYLFADTPGSTPNTDMPVDENHQLYGTFSAKLGNFKLLYSGEITGVENTIPLGDLKDPEVLKQCRLTSLKVFKKRHPRDLCWRTNRRMCSWLIQARLSGIQQQRVAIFHKDGLVNQPIDDDGIAQLEKLNRFNLTRYNQFLHNFLNEIKKFVGDVDCPHTIFEFSVENHSLIYKGKKSTTNSSLTEDFIQFINRI